MSNPLFLTSSNLKPEELQNMVKRIPTMLSPMNPLPTEEKPNLQKLNDIQAVLFDIYGTLLISGTGDISIAQERANLYSVDQILEDNGFVVLHEDINHLHKILFSETIEISHREQKKKGIDYPEVDILEIWSTVLARLIKNSEIEGVLSREALLNISLEYELMVNPVWLMPGAKSLIEKLSIGKYLLGIVSNAQYYTQPSLEALMGSSLLSLGMDSSLWSWSYQIKKAKPCPDIFDSPLNILQKRGIEPQQVLYVGNDMLNDVATAHKRGCRTALFAGDSRSLRLRENDSRCKGLKADIVVTELSQLEDCLK